VSQFTSKQSHIQRKSQNNDFEDDIQKPLSSYSIVQSQSDANDEGQINILIEPSINIIRNSTVRVQPLEGQNNSIGQIKDILIGGTRSGKFKSKPPR
jgi:hypothetical protein